MTQDILKTALEMLASGLSKMPPAFLYPTGGDSGADDLENMLRSTVYPADLHIYTEMVMLVEGRAMLLGAKRNYELIKGRLLVITPGTRHAESYVFKKESYKLLWIWVRANDLVFMISSYGKDGQEDQRYRTTTHSFPVDAVFAKELWLLCSKGRGEVLEPRDQLCIQAYALLAVCDAIESYEKGGNLNRKEHSKSIVNQISSFIEHNYAHSFSINDLAKLVRLSPNYLNALFKKEFGTPLYAFILETRLEHAVNLLKNTRMPVKGVAVSSGFSDPLYFSRIFKKKYKLNPSSFRLK
jgi:AraC-like DNA-binding protein